MIKLVHDQVGTIGSLPYLLTNFINLINYCNLNKVNLNSLVNFDEIVYNEKMDLPRNI